MDEITLPENQSTKFCCFHQTETHQEFLQLYVRCLVILLAFDPDVFFFLAFSTKMCTGLSRDQFDMTRNKVGSLLSCLLVLNHQGVV